jgi:hypothetical protein
MELSFQTDDDFTPAEGVPKASNPLREKAKSKPKKSVAAPAASQAKKLCEPLSGMYKMCAMGLMPFDSELALLIATESDNLGESWVKLAETSPSFRKFLNKMNQASGWGNVMMAHLPIAMAVAARVTPELFGSSEPEETKEAPVE